MTDENLKQETPNMGDQDAAERMVKEASQRYKDVPKSDELKSFKFEKLFEGRIDKENYIYALAGSLLIGFVLSFIPVLGLILCIPLGVVGLGVMARRFHDINQTGWLALIGLIPVINLAAAIYLAITDAVDEGNKYGPKPDPKRGFYHAVLNI